MEPATQADLCSAQPPAARQASGRERRSDERFFLDGPFGHLIHDRRMIPCQFIDICMSGCKVHTESAFTPGALEPVEIALLLFGLVLRIGGVTQWARGCQVGIRFNHPSARSKNQLATLLTCLIDQTASETVIELVKSQATQESGTPILCFQTPVAPRAVAAQAPAKPLSEAPKAEPEPSLTPRAEPSIALNASGDQWPVVVRFLNERSHAQGLIVALNLGACDVKTSVAFPGTVDSRVELSFQIRGLPFQLAGTITQVVDSHTARTVFGELSRRKREELQQVLEEMVDPSDAKTS